MICKIQQQGWPIGGRMWPWPISCALLLWNCPASRITRRCHVMAIHGYQYRGCSLWYTLILDLEVAEIAKYQELFRFTLQNIFHNLTHLALLLAIFLCCCWFGLDLLPLSLNWYPKGLNSNVCELHCHGGLLTFKLMCADTMLASSSRRLLLTLYLTTVPPLSLLCTLDLRLEWQH